MATRIRLKRMGETHYAFYRIVVVDQRKKRDGRVIEEVGIYNPNTNPSTIELKSDRIQHWLSVGAQPSDPVLAMLKKSGDWQTYKKEPNAKNTLETYTKVHNAEEAVEKASTQAQKLKAEKASAAEKAKVEEEAAALEKADAADNAAQAEDKAAEAAQEPVVQSNEVTEEEKANE